MEVCSAIQMVFQGAEEQEVQDVHERLSSIKFADVSGVRICSVLFSDAEVSDLYTEIVIPGRKQKLPLIFRVCDGRMAEPCAWYGVNALHIPALSRWLIKRDSATSRALYLWCQIETLETKLRKIDSTIDWCKRGEQDGVVYTSGEWERKMLRGLEWQLESIQEELLHLQLRRPSAV